MVGETGFEPAPPWSRTRFYQLLKSIEICRSQPVLIEPVARYSLNVVEVCCFWVLSPPQIRLQPGRVNPFTETVPVINTHCHPREERHPPVPVRTQRASPHSFEEPMKCSSSGCPLLPFYVPLLRSFTSLAHPPTGPGEADRNVHATEEAPLGSANPSVGGSRGLSRWLPQFQQTAK